jgi:PhoPQ-activated pathogenicity-related protein
VGGSRYGWLDEPTAMIESEPYYHTAAQRTRRPVSEILTTDYTDRTDSILDPLFYRRTRRTWRISLPAFFVAFVPSCETAVDLILIR